MEQEYFNLKISSIALVQVSNVTRFSQKTWWIEKKFIKHMIKATET